MKHYLKVVLLFLIVALNSCVFDESSNNPDETNGKLMINLSVKDQSSGLATRSGIAPEAGEENVNSIDLIFFENGGNETGSFKAWKKLTSTAGEPLTMNTDIPLDLSALGLSTTATYNILVVANMGDGYLKPTPSTETLDDWEQSIKSLNFQDAKAKVQAYVYSAATDNSDYTTKPLLSNNLLMSTAFTKESKDTKLNIVLQRNVSRFDIYNSDNKYTLASIAVWNAYPYGFVWGGEPNSFEKDVTRITRLYGVKADDQGNPVVGKLYAFENYVPAPVQNDEVTTCLIIGLKNKITGTVSYHRANVNPQASGQSLKRNNVYKVTVNTIKSEGYPSELEAYKGKTPSLSYSINYWDMGSQGTVQLDGDNILAVPTKKVLFNPNGGSYDLSIFTFGQGTLAISKKTLDDGLSVSLSGNILTVAATPLVNIKDKRKGTVELSFGSLKATIDIEQLEGGDLFIQLSPKTIPNFSSKAGVAAPTVTVKASGDWTASIYPPGAGAFFSFEQAGGAAVTDYNSDLSANNVIPIYTFSANSGAATPRYGFLMVSLKEDPSIQATLLLIQNGMPGFDLTPSVSSIGFEYDGKITAGGNNTNTFLVNPGFTEDGTEINGWHYALTGTDASSFTIDELHDLTTLSQNKVTVKAKGQNSTSSVLTAQLQLVLDSDPTIVSKTITITQQPFIFNTNVTGDNLSISEDEDVTSLINIEAPSTFKYTVAFALKTPTSLVHTYDIKMVNESGTEMSLGTQYPIGTKFKFKFPKTLYKDANKDIVYTVTVTLAGSSFTKSFTITRNRLTPIDFSAHPSPLFAH